MYKEETRDRRDQLPDTVRLRKSERTPHQKKREYKGPGVSLNPRPILRPTSFYLEPIRQRRLSRRLLDQHIAVGIRVRTLLELWKSPLISQIVRLLYLFILNITWLTDSTTVQLLIL